MPSPDRPVPKRVRAFPDPRRRHSRCDGSAPRPRRAAWPPPTSPPAARRLPPVGPPIADCAKSPMPAAVGQHLNNGSGNSWQAHPARAPWDRRGFRSARSSLAPSAGRRPLAGSPSAQRTRHPPAPNGTVSGPPSPPRENGPAGSRLPTAAPPAAVRRRWSNRPDTSLRGWGQRRDRRGRRPTPRGRPAACAGTCQNPRAGRIAWD